MARVELKNLCKDYPGGIQAVKNVSLVVEDREFVVLVGPSGCGKSTTLRMIAGLEECTSGEIHIDDVLVNDVPPKNRDIAMVFQNYALYPHMTVYKNMAFGLLLRKYPKSEIDRRVHEAAEILGITELLNRRPRELSGGQRQRVAVGRAIVRQPKVFLFDEPLSNLDAKLRVQMRAEIAKLHARLQSTMIYVTHDQVEAMTMGDRIVVMLDGVIQQVSSPLHLYRHPANRFVGGFIGSPPMNMIEGRLARENGRLFFIDALSGICLQISEDKTGALASYAGKAVILGIRPEHFSSATEQEKEQGIRGTVEMVELTGAETHLYLKTGKRILVARVSPQKIPALGEHYVLQVDAAATYFFDESTQEIIV